MDLQNVSNLVIPEGEVRTIHDKDSRLLWGRSSYNVKYSGDAAQDGTPSPNNPAPVQTVTGEQTVTVSGKNLWNTSNVIDGVGLDGPTGQTYPTATRSTLDYTSLKPDTTYTLSGCSMKSICFYDSNKTFISRSVQYTVTSPSGTSYVRIAFDNTVEHSNIQLESGSTATAYEAYQSQSYTVNLGTTELCKLGIYQDYIYKSGDDWYLHKEISHITRSVSNMTGGNYPGWEDVTEIRSTIGTGINGALSSVTSYMTNIQSADNGVNINTNLSNSRLFFSRSYWGDDHTETYWKTNYPNLVFDIYYVVINQGADTKITDNTLISQLDAIHQFLTRYGYNAIVSGNLPMIINKTNL